MFLILKAAARAQKLRATPDAPEAASPPTDEAVFLAEICDLLKPGGR